MSTQLKRLVVGLLITSMSSCIVVDNTPGPPGPSGVAYFGVDYENFAPYSYWDDNPSVPYNPTLGAYYFTYPGVYEFEYFINPEEYWYGTYELWINAGGLGGIHGEPGLPGLDTYMMLICDPHGFHEHRFDGKKEDESVYKKPLVVEKKIGDQQYRITIQKAKVSERPAQSPKYKK